MNWFSEWSLYLTEVIPNYIYKKYAGYTHWAFADSQPVSPKSKRPGSGPRFTNITGIEATPTFLSPKLKTISFFKTSIMYKFLAVFKNVWRFLYRSHLRFFWLGFWTLLPQNLPRSIIRIYKYFIKFSVATDSEISTFETFQQVQLGKLRKHGRKHNSTRCKWSTRS